MDRGNVNPTQHLPWWLRETTKKTLISLISIESWTRNSPNMNPVWRISIGAMVCELKNFITNRTSQSAGAGIRASNFNRCSDATVRTREVPLVHASFDFITISQRSPVYCTIVQASHTRKHYRAVVARSG